MAKIEMDTDISNNSYERTDNIERLKPIVSKDAIVTTKKSLRQKFIDTFISKDVKDLKHYILLGVIVPTIRDTIINVVETTFNVDDLGYFDRGGYGRRPSDYDRRYPYGSMYRSRGYSRSQYSYDGRRDYRDDYLYSSSNDKVDYKNIILKDRRDAEAIVRDLRERVRSFHQASVGDLYDLLDISGSNVDFDWGWTEENEIGIRRVTNGYLIDVAEAKFLN